MARKDIRRAAHSADANRSRKLGRIHKSGRSRKSGSSGVIADGRKRSIGHNKVRTAASGKRLLSDRIQSEREQFFKAISIVECCEYASSTMAEVATVEYMDGVFDVLLEILNSSAGELGCMVDELGNKKTICA